MGAVIRDSVGTFLAGYAKQAPLLSDAQLVEAFALRWAISMALEDGFHCLHAEGFAYP